MKVAVRTRPLNKRESNPRFHKSGTTARAWHVLDEYRSITQISNTGNSLPERVEGKTFFTFDKAFGEASETKDVYGYAVKELVTGVIAGRNGSCFAYGQVSERNRWYVGFQHPLFSLICTVLSACRQVVERHIPCKGKEVLVMVLRTLKDFSTWLREMFFKKSENRVIASLLFESR